MDITERKITKIAREVSKFTVRQLREEGVGASEFDVIHAVRKNPGITQAGVCRITGLDKGAVARQAAKGYIVRRDNEDDGRSRRLYATEKADGLKSSKAQIETRFYEWLLEPLSDADAAEFARILDVLYRRCKAESKADFSEMTGILKGVDENERE